MEKTGERTEWRDVVKACAVGLAVGMLWALWWPLVLVPLAWALWRTIQRHKNGH